MIHSSNSEPNHPLSSPQYLVNCLHDIKAWMSTNLLTLNSKKTELRLWPPRCWRSPSWCRRVPGLLTRLQPSLQPSLSNSVAEILIHVSTTSRSKKIPPPHLQITSCPCPSIPPAWVKLFSISFSCDRTLARSNLKPSKLAWLLFQLSTGWMVERLHATWWSQSLLLLAQNPCFLLQG